MLKLTRIEKANGANFTEKHLVVLHFTDCESSLLGATFAVSDYAIVGHLDALVSLAKDDKGEIDLDASLALANDTHRDKKEDNAYGFTLPISDLIKGAKFVKTGGIEIAIRHIMGIGKTEADAKADAINREIGRINFAVAKGKMEVIYGEETSEKSEGEETK